MLLAFTSASRLQAYASASLAAQPLSAFRLERADAYVKVIAVCPFRSLAESGARSALEHSITSCFVDLTSQSD